MNQKSTHYRLFHILGWRVYVTRESLRPRQRGIGRKTAYRERMELIGRKCEVCGAPLTIFGNILHTLPKGHPDRNTVDELRLLCSECHTKIQSQVQKRCYDTAAPAYSSIVNHELAMAMRKGEKS